jgi:DNA-directed RNA polymerase specialized sigma24 family protein
MEQKQLKKKRKKKQDKPYYVNSKEFSDALKVYYKTDDDDIGEELGTYVFKIATGLSYAPNFINYTYKEDMVGDAIYKMLLAIKNKKFDITSEYNPFSYFTTIAFHAFINRIKKEKKQREIVSEYQDVVYDELTTSGELSVHLKCDDTASRSDAD